MESNLKQLEEEIGTATIVRDQTEYDGRMKSECICYEPSVSHTSKKRGFDFHIFTHFLSLMWLSQIGEGH
jgi:hypothetical protein